MDDRLNQYLGEAYRRDVLHESLVVEMPDVDPQLVDRMIADIDALRLGPHLANRDFVSYQNRRALLTLREELKKKEAEDAASVREERRDTEREHPHPDG